MEPPEELQAGAGRETWRDLVEALGPPVYRRTGHEPNESFGAHGNRPTSISLSFGRVGRRLVVETSVEPIEDHRMLVEMAIQSDLTYPWTVSEEHSNVVVDGQPTGFRFLRVNTHCWSAVAVVGDRWVYLRGLGISIDEVAIERLR